MHTVYIQCWACAVFEIIHHSFAYINYFVRQHANEIFVDQIELLKSKKGSSYVLVSLAMPTHEGHVSVHL